MTLLEQLSNEIVGAVDASRAFVVCVGTGKATPRTGLVVAPGEIVTIAMAADAGEHVPVHGADGEVAAEVVGFDAASGVALLRAEGFTASASVATAQPRVGDVGVTVACPIPGGHEARLAAIRCVGGPTRLRGGRRVDSYLQTDASRFSGFAAAVHFNAAGEAVAIAMPTHRREEGYLLPMGEVMSIVEQIRAGGSVGRAYLGVQTTAATLPQPVEGVSDGLLVTRVEPGSPAEDAGIVVGEFIIRIGDEWTTSPEELYDALVGRSAGESFGVTAARSDGASRVVEVKVTLRR